MNDQIPRSDQLDIVPESRPDDPQPFPEKKPLSTRELLERCMGKIEFAERVLAKFKSRFEDDLIELENMLEETDADAIKSVAHRLKGAAANVSAEGLWQILGELEQLAHSHRMTEVADRMDHLRDEWSRFVDYVPQWESAQLQAFANVVRKNHD